MLNYKQLKNYNTKKELKDKKYYPHKKNKIKKWNTCMDLMRSSIGIN